MLRAILEVDISSRLTFLGFILDEDGPSSPFLLSPLHLPSSLVQNNYKTLIRQYWIHWSQPSLLHLTNIFKHSNFILWIWISFRLSCNPAPCLFYKSWGLAWICIYFCFLDFLVLLFQLVILRPGLFPSCGIHQSTLCNILVPEIQLELPDLNTLTICHWPHRLLSQS